MGGGGDVDYGVAAGGDGVADGADVAGSVVEEGYGEFLRHGGEVCCDLEACVMIDDDDVWRRGEDRF